MKEPSRQEQVKALLLIHNIPVLGASMARRPGGLFNYVNSGDPFILVGDYLLSIDHTAHQLSKPTILIELRGLGGGFNVIDTADHYEEPYGREATIERFVNKLDNSKLRRLSQKLCNLPR